MKARNIALGSGVLALILAGVFVVFRLATQPDGDPPIEPIAEECWQQLEAQQKLGLLAVRSLETYARIDPGLFDLSDPKRVRVSPGAVPTAPGEEALKRFEGALQVVNGAPALAQRLREGHALALKACGDRCPAKPYAFDVELVQEAKNPDAGVYKWRVKGEVPTNAEWEQGFLNLYGGAPKLSCTDFAVLRARNWSEDETASNMAPPQDGPGIERQKLALNPQAKSEEAENRDTHDQKDPSGREIMQGSAATASPCNSNPHTTCQMCWITRTLPGGYYWNGVKWCCGGC